MLKPHQLLKFYNSTKPQCENLAGGEHISAAEGKVTEDAVWIHSYSFIVHKASQVNTNDWQSIHSMVEEDLTIMRYKNKSYLYL